MKKTAQPPKTAGAICRVTMLLWFTAVFVPHTLAATNKNVQATPPASNALAAIEIPKSDFIIPTSTAQGRDPFFPLSRRLVVDASPKVGKTPSVAPVTLILQGISGSDAKRFALISGRTFVAGEEREIPSGNSRIQVHCLEIREDSVKIQVNGAPMELKLRPGIQ